MRHGRRRCPAAHRDADIGGLQRGRIVHPVAGHQHHLPATAEGIEDPQLVARLDAGKDAPRRRSHRRPSRPAGCPDGASRSDRSPPDGGCRQRVVPGDHDHPHAGRGRRLQRRSGSRTRRIGEGGQAVEDEVALDAPSGRRRAAPCPPGQGRGRPVRRAAPGRRRSQARSLCLVDGLRSAPPSRSVHRSRSTSGAPFMRTAARRPRPTTTLMRLRSDENGSSSVRSQASRSTPAPSAPPGGRPRSGPPGSVPSARVVRVVAQPGRQQRGVGGRRGAHRSAARVAARLASAARSLTSTVSPPRVSRRRVMRPSVIVPVLSVHTTSAAPMISTTGSDRTSACRSSMRRVPKARARVITTGRPSGMAATASATAAMNVSSSPRPPR